MKRCFFADGDYGPCSFRADGQPDPAHLIEAQRVKHAGLAEHAYDPRLIVPVCRHHHDRLDGRNALNKITLDFHEYPMPLHAFAAEFGFYWAGERDGWRKEAQATSGPGWPE